VGVCKWDLQIIIFRNQKVEGVRNNELINELKDEFTIVIIENEVTFSNQENRLKKISNHNRKHKCFS
jgi:hypothetical protein